MNAPLVELIEVAKRFPARRTVPWRAREHVDAVSGVTLGIGRAETVGLVGESGSGKTTLGRLAARLLQPTTGSVRFDGQELAPLSGARLRHIRRHFQYVFQDPFSSLDPLTSVAVSVDEPLRTHTELNRPARDRRVAELFDMVGLDPGARHRYPSEFSGGQLQRIAIARAIAAKPDFVVLDEAISALDVSSRNDLLELLAQLQSELGVAYLFIAHDLTIVERISDRIAVMYLGRIVEHGDAATIVTRPRHPYTAALLSAIPVPDPLAARSRQRIVLNGEIPSPLRPPPGCRFNTRCPHAMPVCAHDDPPALRTDDGTTVHCHLHTFADGPKLAGAPLASIGIAAAPAFDH